MAVKVPCANAFKKFGEYDLNVTLRDYPGSELLLAKEDETPEPMEMEETIAKIAEKTIANWLRTAHCLDDGVIYGNVMMASAEELVIKITPENEDPLVTVWGKYKGVSMTVVSNEAPIYAYRAMKAWGAGVRAAREWLNQENGQPATEAPARRVGTPQPQDTIGAAGMVNDYEVATDASATPLASVIPVEKGGELESVNCKTIKCKTSKKGKVYYVAGGVTIWDTKHLADVVEAGIPVDKLAQGLSIDMTQYPELAVKVHYVIDESGYRKFMGLDVEQAQQFSGQQSGNKQPF